MRIENALRTPPVAATAVVPVIAPTPDFHAPNEPESTGMFRHGFHGFSPIESVRIREIRVAPPHRLMKNLKTCLPLTLLVALFACSLSVLAQSAGISGERCYARIVRVKQGLTVQPNQVGTFPEISVRPATPIAVQVIYNAGLANQKVTLTALEGGTLGNGLSTQDITLDSLKTATFSFATGAGRGLYRVAVRKGTDLKILEFWVGEPMPKYSE